MDIRDFLTHHVFVLKKKKSLKKKSRRRKVARRPNLKAMRIGPKPQAPPLPLLPPFFFDGLGRFDKKGCPSWVSLQFLLVLAR